MEHLSPNAIEALELSDQDRITYIRKERWLGYTTAKTILNQLTDLINYPKRARMPNLLIIGDTNTGKTTIAKHFHSQFPAYMESPIHSVVCPVLYLQAPPIADEGRFYASIIQRYAAPYRVSDRVERKMNQAITLMQNTQIKMLMIDEFHHILAGNSNKHRAMLNVIKYIGNELMIPIVGIGTKDAFVAIQSDPQLSNRFDHAYLPRWQYGNEFRNILLSLEHVLPLKQPSNLIEKSIAEKILALTNGTFGEMYNLLTELAVYGVTSGEERISLDNLPKINWIPPYERARVGSYM